MTHLWEVDHSYYCNKGNYYARESVGDNYKSWSDFIAEYKDADFDMNLVFRFDWDEVDEDTGESNYNGDNNYRNGVLAIFWLGQRKGLYRYSEVEVCRADEPEVIKFLQPRFDHLKALWSPLV